jgi:hypothetical protein
MKNTKKYAIFPFIGVAATIAIVVTTAVRTDVNVINRSRGLAAHGLIGVTGDEFILTT